VSVSDTFGFLPIDRTITFDDGVIQPAPSLPADIALIKQTTHRDGHLYPPLIHDAALYVFEPWGEATERPAHLYRLPVSHVLRLDSIPIENTFRLGDGSFLMHFVGLMFGYRLQFGDWWFDGRLPMFPRHWRVPPPLNREGALLSDGYRLWRTWPPPERTRFTNLLYMHVRSVTYEWDWERFAVNYMVFDGCYRTAVALGLVAQARNHAARLDVMLQWLQMPPNNQVMSDLVRFRNDLFHEALWDRRQPGGGSMTGPAQADHLSRINDRLLFGLAGYRGPYLTVPWWVIGQAPM
jgi:hypothetical protein